MPPRKPSQKKAAAPLEKYRGKRDFKKTPEPGPKSAKASGHSFVVQEHQARSHHFDFRLEMNGVLVSWAVPKGVPEDPAAKRLAVHVEDHPLEYGSFEGVIPEGNYGAGKVSIWDKGEWISLDMDCGKAIDHGKLKFVLKGQRLEGVYILARMGEEPNWLMRKLKEQAPTPLDATLEKEQAKFIAPQLARVVPSVPAGREWVHEIKYDGYRLIAVKRAGKVTIYTRNALDWTQRFKSVASNLHDLTEKDFVMDGEAVVFDQKGRSSFGHLQAALQAGEGEKITYVAFDLLHYDGVSLRDLPLSSRIEQLWAMVREEAGPVCRSKVWAAEMGRELFKQACETGLEGIISKRAEGTYLEGARRDWAKSKCRARQEFVLCGYTRPKSSLPAFGALVLASYENGKLIPRGKVGTGFSDKERIRLLSLFEQLLAEHPTLPLRDPEVVWLEPNLVVEVEFAEITRDGSIRQGSFVGLREDKAAADVHIEGVQMAALDSKGAMTAGITITHPDRLVYPADQITKMEVVKYYERVGDLMLPFVSKRPLALIRAPDGITGEMFFQKSFPKHVPEHVTQTQLDDGTQVISVKDVKGIVALAQFGVIEIHPWGAPLSMTDKPDFLIWDFDPDPAVPWVEVLGAALLLRDYLAEMGLATILKTSGGKGLHVMLPIKKSHDWETMRGFTKAVSQAIAAQNPKRLIIASAKAKRTGRIFIDWMRNGRGSTCIAPWGLRARAGATVSMPVNWADLREIQPDGFTIHMPPETPDEWKHFKFQTVTKTVLGKLVF